MDRPNRETRARGVPVDYKASRVIGEVRVTTPRPNPPPGIPSRLRPNGPNGSPGPNGTPTPGGPSQHIHQQQIRRQQQYAETHFPSSFGPGVLPVGTPPPGQKRSRIASNNPKPVMQALGTTYSSRMATGVTTLAQPLVLTGGPPNSYGSTAAVNGSAGTTGGAATFEMTRSGRPTRTRVNYAEVGDGDDDSEVSDENGKKGTPAHRGEDRDRRRTEEQERQRGWSWLGERTPAHRVKMAQIRPLKLPHFAEDFLDRAAMDPTLLAPIRLEIETETHRIRDCFTWNINETMVTPELFAKYFCHDLAISEVTHGENIARTIRNQLDEYRRDYYELFFDDEALLDSDDEEDEDDNDDEDEGEAESRARKRQKVARYQAERDDGSPEKDCRIIVNLDVQIADRNLRDRIEWDLESPLTPEEFTHAYCADLNLTGEAIPVIATAIHEELLKHKKDALNAGWYGPGATRSSGFAKNGAKKLLGVWRGWQEAEEFGPVFIKLTAEDSEKKEQERQREQRRAILAVEYRFETTR